MQTKYAFGRNTLPTPVVTVENGGSISGNNDTYYFWVKARNRVGHNTHSSSTQVVVGNAKQVRISAASFAIYDYEGWMNILVTVSKTNDYATSRTIYKQELYETDQVTRITPEDVIITTNFSLNGTSGSVEVEDIDALPTAELLNGFRISMVSTERVYEYSATSNLPADNITVLPALTGQWLAVPSNSLREVDVNASKELFQVNDNELIEAPLPAAFQFPVTIKYYIVNNELVNFNTGELQLNAYISDKSLQASYFVKVLGYLDLDNYVLDTTGIDYVNTVVTYPGTKIKLSKALPANNALVVEITPSLILDSTVVEGTYITLYPKLNQYEIVEGIGDYGEPVADIATLKALPNIVYKDRQVRFVESKRTFYAFDNESTLADNGDTVLIPAGNPTTGRWLANSVNILPETVTPEMLSDETVDLFTGTIETTTTTLTLSDEFVIDTDTSTNDYYILVAPEDDGGTTIINIIGTLANNTTRAILLELRQDTGTIEFHSSVIFPGGTSPIFSGNGKTDLFVLKLVKDGNGVTKKRGFMVQKDIG